MYLRRTFLKLHSLTRAPESPVKSSYFEIIRFIQILNITTKKLWLCAI